MERFIRVAQEEVLPKWRVNQTDPLPPPPPSPSLPAAFVLYEDTDCFVVLIRNQRYLIPKGENQK